MNPKVPAEPARSRPNIVVVDDPGAVAQEGANRVRDAAGRALAARGCFRLALAGGATPKSLYACLAVDLASAPLDWTRVQLFFGDERCVPPEHPDSNFGMVKASLLDHISIPAANVHRWRGEETVPSDAAAAYAKGLLRPLDLALLGLGADGHTASLFPHTTVLHETNAACAAVDVPALKTTRLTLTWPVFAETRELIFLVTGIEKAATLREVLTGPLRPLDLPSQPLMRRGQSVTILCDRAAASLLTALS